MTDQNGNRESGIDRRTVLRGAAASGVGLVGVAGVAGAKPGGGGGGGGPCFKGFDCEDSEATYVKIEFVTEDKDDDGVLEPDDGECYFEEETDTGLIEIKDWESKDGEKCEPTSVTWESETHEATVVKAYGGTACDTVEDPDGSYNADPDESDGDGLTTPSGNTAAISNLQFCIVPTEVCVDVVTDLEAGDEITEDTFDNLTISSEVSGNTIIAAEEGVQTDAFYGAPNDNTDFNGCMGDKVDVGFGDIDAKSAGKPQNIDFTFDNSVSEFELRMLDYGDYNPQRVDHHKVVITAYDAGNNVEDSETLEYWSNGGVNPTTGYDSSAKDNVIYDDLWEQGDACDAEAGEPGDYTFTLTGDIASVELRFPSGHDPNIAFDLPCYLQ